MKTALAALALLLAPVAALAQSPQPEPVDPIGALIDQQNGAEIDEETAETLGAPEPPSTPPPSASPAAGYVPSYARPSASGLDRPVMIHETGLSPDGPPDLSQQTYESRVRGSIAAAQELQGPLDGAWSLTDAAGTKLYAFQMVDPGGGYGLEGAWRDLRRGAGIGDVGVIDSVQRSGAALTLRFVPREGAAPVSVQLNQTNAGQWTGALSEASGSADVTLVRDGPQAASYAMLGTSTGYAPRPYDSTVRAAPRPAAKATTSKKKKATAKKSSKKKAPAKRKKKA
jgi:hypothetical protein